MDGFRTPANFMVRLLILGVAFRVISRLGCKMARTLHESADRGEAILRTASADPMPDPEFWSRPAQESRVDGTEWANHLR